MLSNEYEKFVALENLELAWRRVRNSVRFETKDRIGITVYGSQIEKHLGLLLKKLQSKAFLPSHPEYFFIPKKDGSSRCLTFMEMDDRLFYQAIGNIIAENTFDYLVEACDVRKSVFSSIPTNPNASDKTKDFIFRRTFSTRYSKGQYNDFKTQILKSMSEFVRNFDEPYLIRTDISSYYYSIDHNQLIDLLKSRLWLSDEYLLNLLKDSLKCWTDQHYECGIPVGYEVSDLLANLYLVPLDESLEGYRTLRYVDDIYIFVHSKAEVKKVLKIVDENLTKLILKRNVIKTDVIKLTEITKEKLERKLRNDLSEFREDEDTQESQNSLHKKFYDYYIIDPECDDAPEEVCNKNKIVDIGKVSFILYRLRRRDETIRDVALCIIDNYPRYALHASTYLARNFRRDDHVVRELWNFVYASYEHTEVRFHCLKSLKQMRGFQHIEEYLKTHLASIEDWHMRFLLLDLYIGNESNHFTLISKIARYDRNVFVRIKALFLAFKLTKNIESKTKLIDVSFNDNNILVNKLGIYLWRRSVRINIDNLSVTRLTLEMRETFLNQKELGNIQLFETNFEKFFEFRIPNDFPVDDIFGGRVVANQMLVNAIDKLESGMNDLVLNLYSLTCNVLGALAQIKFSHEKINKQNLNTIVQKYFSEDKVIKENTGALRNFYKIVNNNDRVEEDGRSGLLAQARTLYRYSLNQVNIALKGIPMRTDIFICYSHTDNSWREKVQQALKPHFRDSEINVWDDKKIKIGKDWDQEIKNALHQSKVAILLVSMSFLASDYIHNTELREIFDAAQHGGLEIVWIAIGPSAYKSTPIGKLQCAHDKPDKALSQRSKAQQEQVLVDIAQYIADIFQNKNSKT